MPARPFGDRDDVLVEGGSAAVVVAAARARHGRAVEQQRGGDALGGASPLSSVTVHVTPSTVPSVARSVGGGGVAARIVVAATGGESDGRAPRRVRRRSVREFSWATYIGATCSGEPTSTARPCHPCAAPTADLRSGDDAVARLSRGSTRGASGRPDRARSPRTSPSSPASTPTCSAICIVTVDGTVYEVGDTRQRVHDPVDVQAVHLRAGARRLGPDAVGARIGVEPTGDAFNAISLDPVTGRPLNPMVNAGAITAADLDPTREHGDAALERLLDGTRRSPGGRSTSIDAASTTRSATPATATGRSPTCCAAPGSSSDDVDDVARRCTSSQCSVAVDCRDLGADGGDARQRRRQPARPASVARHAADRARRAGGDVDAAACTTAPASGSCRSACRPRAASAAASSPCCPGQLGIGVFSPRLDPQGNSVRGVNVCRELAVAMGTAPGDDSGRRRRQPQPTLRTLADGGSSRRRADEAIDRLADGRRRAGDRAPRRRPVRRRRIRGAAARSRPRRVADAGRRS